jgi:hypothetical protein
MEVIESQAESWEPGEYGRRLPFDTALSSQHLSDDFCGHSLRSRRFLLENCFQFGTITGTLTD